MASGAFQELAVGGEPVRLYVSGAPGASPAVVVYHPWWGLNDDVIAYADRLAGTGCVVAAPDLVRGRIATTIEAAEDIVKTKDDDHGDAVALAAIDWLATAGGAKRIGAVGFSMGAQWAIGCAAGRPVVGASVVYYGTFGGPSLAAASAPILAHFAEADPYEPEESIEWFERELKDAGRDFGFHRYAGTGHWFAEPSRDAWRPEAAELAFERTLEFLREHLRAGRD